MTRQFLLISTILSLILLLIGLNLFGTSRNDIRETWKIGIYDKNTGHFTKNVPITIVPSFSKLPSIEGEDRFELVVRVYLDKSSPLYKPGECFVVGHSKYAGSIIQGDSIEYSYPDYAFLNDGNLETIFHFIINKGHNTASTPIAFSGGRFNPEVKGGPTDFYVSASFKTDQSISVFITYKLLDESKVKVPHESILKKPFKFNYNGNSGKQENLRTPTRLFNGEVIDLSPTGINCDNIGFDGENGHGSSTIVHHGAGSLTLHVSGLSAGQTFSITDSDDWSMDFVIIAFYQYQVAVAYETYGGNYVNSFFNLPPVKGKVYLYSY